LREAFSIRRNVSAKILLVTLAAVMTVMSLAELVVYLSERAGQLREMEARVRATSARLAYNLADPLSRMNDPDIQKTISLEMRNREILGILLDGADGRRISARVHPDACPVPLASPPVEETLDASSRMKREQPIVRAGRLLGTVRVYFSDLAMREAMRQRAVESVVHTVLLSIVFSAVLFLCLRRIILRPLETLEASVALVSRGDLGVSIPVSSHDEVGRLGDSFNRMVARLQAKMAALRETEARLRKFSERQQRVIEGERARIAREIHDDLSQQLTALRLDLHWIGRRLLPEQAEVAARVQAMIAGVDQTHDVVEHVIRELRPQILDDLGLVPAIEWLAREFETRTGIPADVACGPGKVSPTPEQATALFRISQEALTNVARHADAGLVRIRIRERFSVLKLEIRDDGRGFDPKGGAGDGSHGLMGIAERVRIIGGRLRVRSAPGAGTSVTVLAPERPEGEAA
jgi:signal transduction histidine kinase